ncbi:MAG: peroxiredoxin, partial [Candidatus Dadabacteria bacterium]|nr:peroxiredoxin [Candidatus Dadabacteria bacterium]NIV43010.1 redoxin domain-containing protein [Candidatus Dadabacteria bacterium]NIX15504.1 redoxin domain-containing protein [Candidatus Dadabacteria bacterium]
MSKLSIGDKAPHFEAQSYEGNTISLSDYAGKSSVILYFYPRDNTPGCTKEACSMRDGMDDLSGLGIQVLGVSTDSVKSHEKFRDKFNLNFPLLSDKSKEIVKAYDVQSAFGSASRKSFLID